MSSNVMSSKQQIHKKGLSNPDAENSADCQNTQSQTHLYRAAILHFPESTLSPTTQFYFEQDGALVVDEQTIVAVGAFASLASTHPKALIHDYSGYLIVPGLIDSHLHFPQTEMLASYGEQLMEWLENYTFPTERKFADPEYCALIAEAFINELLKNGTTTAFAYASVHKESVEALFAASSSRNMSMVTGKTCMDTLCPDWIQDTPEKAALETEALINKWHNKGRNHYAITPRFVPTSTNKQLQLLGELAQQYPDVFVQTHLSENKDEIAIVETRFPEHRSYLEVYNHFGFVRERSIFGHCIHLSEADWSLLRDSGAVAAFCPSSNLFLGSGLYNLDSANRHQVHTVLASDVGGGTSFNMLRTYGEAYKICQLQQINIGALQGLYMMTQGAAQAHKLTHEIGNLNPGSVADFIVLNPSFDSLTALRNKHQTSIQDQIFGLGMLGDDRAVVQTFVAGIPMLPEHTPAQASQSKAYEQGLTSKEEGEMTNAMA